MTFPPDHATAALVIALTQTLKLTFDALADMYERKDGPWVDELRNATLNTLITDTQPSSKTLPAAEVARVGLLFDKFRCELEPRDDTAFGEAPRPQQSFSHPAA